MTWAVVPLLFGSGFCALVYQIAWQREFRLIFGASTAASAAVIAVFMGGLGLGGWVLGPRADARRNPLRFYAVLEVAVALSAAATPLLLELARRAYLALGGTETLGASGGTVLRLLLAGVVLLVPTFLAGGTLGAAARAIEREGDGGRRVTALLYGMNTLGAVAGCVLATFWLLEAFGTRTTLWLAALLNLGIAGAAAVVSARPAAVAATPLDAERAPPSRPVAPPAFVLTAAAIVGFSFFLLELVWYRMLGPILGGTVYTFGLVLAMALLGIALGGLLYGPTLRRLGVGLHAFAITCFVEAVTVIVPYALGDRIALLALDLRPPAGAVLSAYLPGWAAVTAIVVLPTSVVAGIQFPLLVALLGQGREQLARQLGRAYFWNTAGGIGGALAGGFGFLPLLSAPGCWKVVAVLLALLAVAATLADRRRPRFMPWVATASLLGVMVPLTLAEGPTAVWRHSGIGAGRANAPVSPGPNARRAWMNEIRRSVTWEREGVESSVAIQTTAGLSFVVNGKVDGNARNDAPTQVMSGILGALLRPEARRSLVIGLGTGSTAGWLAAVPGMETTDVVELEPAILDVARLCAPVNQDAMSNPRVRITGGDAREVLMAGRSRYDLVFSEPSNPYRSGVASLFTREFYEAVAARLEDDGLFMQWIQAYEVDRGTVASVISTVSQVFPEIEIWQVHQIDLVIVAGRRPLAHDAASLRARLRTEPFASAARGAWRATELEDVLARFVGGRPLVNHLRGEPTGPRSAGDRSSGTPAINTDDRNRVEFSFARTLSRSGLFDVPDLRRSAAEQGGDRPYVNGAVDWSRVVRQRAAIYAIAGRKPPTDANTPEPERLRAEALEQYLAGDLRDAVATFRRQPAAPEGAVETTLFAEGLADAGDPAAVGYIKELRAISVPEAEAATARLALRLGQLEVARDALVASFVHYRSDPWPGQVPMVHALALAHELAQSQRALVPLLVEALGPPFSVAALEEPRRFVRLSVAMMGALDDHCAEPLEAYEPHVPWRREILQYRSRCYERRRDLRAPLAKRDLAEFERSEKSQPPARTSPGAVSK